MFVKWEASCSASAMTEGIYIFPPVLWSPECSLSACQLARVLISTQSHYILQAATRKLFREFVMAFHKVRGPPVEGSYKRLKNLPEQNFFMPIVANISKQRVQTSFVRKFVLLYPFSAFSQGAAVLKTFHNYYFNIRVSGTAVSVSRIREYMPRFQPGENGFGNKFAINCGRW